MEYSYKNSPKEKEVTVQLQAYDLAVTSNQTRQIIPYSEINEVRLNKKGGVYFMELSSFGLGKIIISSQNFDQKRNRVDQCRGYMTFARVLHMHLLEKSKANYSTGFNSSRFLFVLGFWLMASLLLFFIEEYFNFIPASPVLISGLVFASGALLLFGTQINHWPRHYNPTNIPLHLIPSGN